MGSGSSCYPGKDHRASIEHEPYDAKRLLSELITVQTAIVLTDDLSDPRDFGATDKPRKSLEYTITTSLTVPTMTLSHGHHEGKHDLMAPSGLEFQGGALMDILTTHFKHRVDVVKRENCTMPSIQETSEISTC